VARNQLADPSLEPSLADLANLEAVVAQQVSQAVPQRVV
jgi:hypothetical protein